MLKYSEPSLQLRLVNEAPLKSICISCIDGQKLSNVIPWFLHSPTFRAFFLIANDHFRIASYNTVPQPHKQGWRYTALFPSIIAVLLITWQQHEKPVHDVTGAQVGIGL